MPPGYSSNRRITSAAACPPPIACAALIACLIGEGLRQKRIGGLPVHHFTDEDDDLVAKPCAEINLSSNGAEVMRGLGLVPIHSVWGEDSVQIGEIRTVAL